MPSVLALLRQKEEGDKFEEGLNAALHKLALSRASDENRLLGRSFECAIIWASAMGGYYSGLVE
jgi:hypothetical protein